MFTDLSHHRTCGSAYGGFLHHARKPPFSFYMTIENAYSIDEMRFMLFFIELRFMLFL